MEFTGDPERDVCPISFAPVRSLEHPVGFDAAHAYECNDVVLWLTRHKPLNPMTAAPLHGRRVEVWDCYFRR